MQLQGVYTALVTPFTDGEIDYTQLRELVELQIAGELTVLFRSELPENHQLLTVLNMRNLLKKL